MSRFNAAKPSTATENLAGGKAYKMSTEMELVHAVLTTFLEDKFYESGNDRAKRIADLVSKVDPQFSANLAVIARQEFNMRSVTTVILGTLAIVHRGDSIVGGAIVQCAVRPDDLTELVAYITSTYPKNGIPKQVKRGCRNAILKFSPYQLAKYRMEGKSVSLVDLFNLVHPKAQHASEEQRQAWKDLMEGKLVSKDTWETEISNAENDEERTQNWEKLILENKIGYMALLRNLNNLQKYGVSEATITKALAKLTDPEQVKKSRQIPFRFLTAFQAVKGNREMSDAISEAMDIAVSNVPELPGNTLIAVDCSGSMTSGGDTAAIIKASIFAATLLKANKKADVIQYDTSVVEFTGSGRTPVLDLAQNIINSANGGGTNTSLVFEYAVRKIDRDKKYYDRIIILSDNESWQDSYYGRGPNVAYNAYKAATGRDPFVYAIDIQGHGTKDVTGGKVFHLAGWSDKLLEFIGKVEEGESLVQYVKNYHVTARNED